MRNKFLASMVLGAFLATSVVPVASASTPSDAPTATHVKDVPEIEVSNPNNVVSEPEYGPADPNYDPNKPKSRKPRAAGFSDGRMYESCLIAYVDNFTWSKEPMDTVLPYKDYNQGAVEDVTTGKAWQITGLSEKGIKRLQQDHVIVLPDFGPNPKEIDFAKAADLSDSAHDRPFNAGPLVVGKNAFANLAQYLPPEDKDAEITVGVCFTRIVKDNPMLVGGDASRENPIDITPAPPTDPVREDVTLPYIISVKQIAPRSTSYLDVLQFGNRFETPIASDSYLRGNQHEPHESSRTAGLNEKGKYTVEYTTGYDLNANYDYIDGNGNPDSLPSTKAPLNIPGFYILDGAFKNSNITKMTLPEGLMYIGEEAFAGTGFTSVKFPTSLRVLGKGAFKNARSLKSIDFSSIPYNEDGLEDLLFEANSDLRINSLGDDIYVNTNDVPGMQILREEAFYGTNLSELALPSTLRMVGAKAFSHSALTKVTLDRALSTIGDEAFSHNFITKVEKPELFPLPDAEDTDELYANIGLHSLGKNAFAYNSIQDKSVVDAFKDVDEENKGAFDKQFVLNDVGDAAKAAAELNALREANYKKDRDAFEQDKGKIAQGSLARTANADEEFGNIITKYIKTIGVKEMATPHAELQDLGIAEGDARIHNITPPDGETTPYVDAKVDPKILADDATPSADDGTWFIKKAKVEESKVFDFNAPESAKDDPRSYFEKQIEASKTKPYRVILSNHAKDVENGENFSRIFNVSLADTTFNLDEFPKKNTSKEEGTQTETNTENKEVYTGEIRVTPKITVYQGDEVTDDMLKAYIEDFGKLPKGSTLIHEPIDGTNITKDVNEEGMVVKVTVRRPDPDYTGDKPESPEAFLLDTVINYTIIVKPRGVNAETQTDGKTTADGGTQTDDKTTTDGGTQTEGTTTDEKGTQTEGTTTNEGGTQTEGTTTTESGTQTDTPGSTSVGTQTDTNITGGGGSSHRGGGYLYSLWYQGKLTMNGEKDKVRQEYIYGYPDMTFRPEGSLTRAEFAALMRRLTEGISYKRTTFPDANRMWASFDIAYAEQKGLMVGYEDGTFRPNQPVTRAEFSAVMSRYLGGGATKDIPFSDVRDHWALADIAKIHTAGVVGGYPDGTFKPDRPITRAEAVAILNKVFKRGADVDFIHNKVENPFIDIDPSHWSYNDMINASHRYLYSGKDMDVKWIKILKFGA